MHQRDVGHRVENLQRRSCREHAGRTEIGGHQHPGWRAPVASRYDKYGCSGSAQNTERRFAGEQSMADAAVPNAQYEEARPRVAGGPDNFGRGVPVADVDRPFGAGAGDFHNQLLDADQQLLVRVGHQFRQRGDCAVLVHKHRTGFENRDDANRRFGAFREFMCCFDGRQRQPVAVAGDQNGTLLYQWQVRFAQECVASRDVPAGCRHGFLTEPFSSMVSPRVSAPGGAGAVGRVPRSL